MNQYVLRLNEGARTGWYVAPAGSERSYVKDLRKARRYKTREAAEKDRCEGNERVSTIEDECCSSGIGVVIHDRDR